MGKILLVLMLSLQLSKSAWASEFNYSFNEDLEKGEFESLAKNMVTPMRFNFQPLVRKPLTFGAAYRQSELEANSKNLIQSKSSQTAPNAVDSFAVMVNSIPLGLSYAQLGYNDFHYWGVGLRSIIPAGGITLSLRGGYTYLVGNQRFCAPSVNGELLAHFNLPLIKPFVGAGVSQHKASYTPEGSLQDYEHFWKDYYFLGGVRLNLPVPLSVGAELNTSNQSQILTVFAMFSI